ALLLVIIAAAGLCLLSTSAPCLRAAPPADKYEDLAEFHFAGGGVSGTGIRDTGGFTVVTVQADKTRTKLSVSFAFKEEKRTADDFRIVAVDAAGKRHEAQAESRVSAGGKGVVVVTLLSEFSLGSDKIDALVIRQRVDK